MPSSEIFVAKCLDLCDGDLGCSLLEIEAAIQARGWHDYSSLLRHLPDDVSWHWRPDARTNDEMRDTRLSDVVGFMLDFQIAHVSDKEMGWFFSFDAQGRTKEGRERSWGNRALRELVVSPEARDKVRFKSLFDAFKEEMSRCEPVEWQRYFPSE